MIYLVSAIRSLGSVSKSGQSALIPQITPEDKLVRINGIYSTISNADVALAYLRRRLVSSPLFGQYS